VIYTAEDFIGGDSSISFVNENSQPSDQADIFRGGHLINVLIQMGVGKYGCSTLDKANINVYPDRCPE